MPAHTVIVHNDAAFLQELSAELRARGTTVVTYADAMQALDALDSATTIEVLVTRVDFGPGTLNGIALARMAQFRRPEVRVLFVGRPEFQELAAGLGTFIAAPAAVSDLVASVDRLLADGERQTSDESLHLQGDDAHA